MSTTVLSNIRARLRLAPGNARDALLRLRIATQSSKDTGLRLRLFQNPPQIRDGITRLRLLARRTTDSGARLRLFVPISRDIGAMRIRLLAVSSKNIRCRLRMLIQTNADSRLRFRVVSSVGRSNPVVPALPSSLTPQLFASQGPALPLVPPLLPYQVNGIALDQPVLCTAPGSTGLLVVAGSVFTLSFQNMSAATNNILVNGLATMTFALSTGEMVTGPVLLAVRLIGATTVVTITTQTDISVNRWVVSAQFP